jgi:hypothetical protein
VAETAVEGDKLDAPVSPDKDADVDSEQVSDHVPELLSAADFETELLDELLMLNGDEALFPYKVLDTASEAEAVKRSLLEFVTLAVPEVSIDFVLVAVVEICCDNDTLELTESDVQPALKEKLPVISTEFCEVLDHVALSSEESVSRVEEGERDGETPLVRFVVENESEGDTVSVESGVRDEVSVALRKPEL